jgi:hypothetical protein
MPATIMKLPALRAAPSARGGSPNAQRAAAVLITGARRPRPR